jgi:hypothetical protein
MLRTATAFHVLAGLARDEKTTKAGIPKNPLQAALTLPLRERDLLRSARWRSSG